MPFFYSLFFVSNLWAYDLVFQESVVLDVPIEQAFYFAGNASNDIHWRSEVHSIKTDSEFNLGGVYIEDAFLGVHYNYITKVEIVDIKAPLNVIYETTKDNPYRLKSSRSFKKMSSNKTLFEYQVFVEKDLVYDIWQFQIPLKLADTGYSFLMRSYLNRLKIVIKNYVRIS